MKCCSRSTFGIYIGCIYILFDTVGLIFYWYLDDAFAARFIFSIIYILLVCNSSFLIVGIVKKRYKLIQPWLILYGLILTVMCLYFLHSITLSTCALMYMLALLVIGLFGLTLGRIYNLYRDIRIQNIENTCKGQRIAKECTIELIV
ncbi:uncharacterized protein LOC119613153 [Lucilia sericata]|uniref:uncharacterized protein LOC119613149 n=1 Tax=Lucilia sericata TaxID=13632 RepID=UPI0018A7F20C|nr:uncharacterized protein LOC119613149 [Lucilia sericata]XP_037825026.1 uncharacterized protein LOC119613153 [Lucilia sericata]